MDKDGGGAFPARGCFDDAGELIAEQRGMSLRDYFAGLALQGWLSSYGEEAEHLMSNPKQGDFVARRSYEMADAMLKARKP